MNANARLSIVSIRERSLALYCVIIVFIRFCKSLYFRRFGAGAWPPISRATSVLTINHCLLFFEDRNEFPQIWWIRFYVVLESVVESFNTVVGLRCIRKDSVMDIPHSCFKKRWLTGTTTTRSAYVRVLEVVDYWLATFVIKKRCRFKNSFKGMFDAFSLILCILSE